MTDCPLSDKERQTIELTALGKPAKVVAYEMGVPRNAIVRYLAAAKKKMGSANVVHTVAIAIKSGWIQQ